MGINKCLRVSFSAIYFQMPCHIRIIKHSSTNIYTVRIQSLSRQRDSLQISAYVKCAN
jgi:hypothetical protein